MAVLKLTTVDKVKCVSKSVVVETGGGAAVLQCKTDRYPWHRLP